MTATRRPPTRRPAPSRRRILVRRGVALAVVTVLPAGIAAGLLGGFGAGTPDPVNVFPIPGGRVASPRTEITFRGAPIDRVGTISVTGSRSGRHTGWLEADSDGRGGSFIPARPFQPGELVTVSTHLEIVGAHRGTWQFHVATPAGALPSQPLPPAARVPGDVLGFNSRADLTPPAVQVTDASPQTARGDIFLTPQQGPVQNGPMILTPNGTLVWFKPVPKGDMAADLKVQRYRGRPVITWWQGYSGAGIGAGEDVIDDTSYRRLAIVRAANGLYADLHDFQITPEGTAVITAYYPVHWDASAAGGASHQVVLDSVVQEIDIKTGLPVFQWDSLDHVPLTDSYEPMPRSAGAPFDYFHVNSVQRHNGNLIVSARNTWAAYNIDADGHIAWTLGGKRTSFAMGPGAKFAFQHDVHATGSGDQTVTLFDDGAGPPKVHRQSRGLTLKLDRRRGTATVLRAEDHTPPLVADFEGNVQELGAGEQLLGWGQQPYFTQFDPRGTVVFEGRFVGDNSSYRAYRFAWAATPATRPVVAASRSGATTTVYASWNGATQVAAWRVLAGGTPTSLRAVGGGAKRGFETQLTVPAAGYVAVQAVDARGRVMSTSATVAPG